MFRLIITLTLLTLCSCTPSGSEINYEQETQKSHSLEELFKLHESVVAAQGKDIYFIQPIGKFGEAGVDATLQYIDDKGESVSTYNNMELVFGVAVSAKQNTGYVMCEDEPALQRLRGMADRGGVPDWQSSKFDAALASFCEAGRSS